MSWRQPTYGSKRCIRSPSGGATVGNFSAYFILSLSIYPTQLFSFQWFPNLKHVNAIYQKRTNDVLKGSLEKLPLFIGTKIMELPKNHCKFGSELLTWIIPVSPTIRSGQSMQKYAHNDQLIKSFKCCWCAFPSTGHGKWRKNLLTLK